MWTFYSPRHWGFDLNSLQTHAAENLADRPQPLRKPAILWRPISARLTTVLHGHRPVRDLRLRSRFTGIH